MAFTLFWETAKPGVKVEGVGDRVDVLKTLIETFGRDLHNPLCPVELAKSHVFTLRSLAGGNGGTVYGHLADLIEVHGKIRLWGRD